MDFRISVYPHYPHIKINRLINMKFLSSSFVKNIDFTVSFLKKMRIKKLVYGTMKPSKIGGGFMNQYNIIVQQLLAYLTKRKQL